MQLSKSLCLLLVALCALLGAAVAMHPHHYDYKHHKQVEAEEEQHVTFKDDRTPEQKLMVCQKQGGEFRREHHCVAVKHARSNVCCWMMHNRVHVGVLPTKCCGSMWDADCENIVTHVCENVHA
eukprot:PhM_4_TR5168/c0_g1_i1/m.79895